jgi:hypothetical protein
MGKLHDLAGLGQAIWFDYIQRSLISSGELQRLIDQGVRGVTSNPTIFEKAIAGSRDYDDALRRSARAGKSNLEIYEELVLRDILLTSDLFLPVYVDTRGRDGYVSLEVSPDLAYDTDRTIQEGKRLFDALGRPNVMIKVPATDAGIAAVEALISLGVNVNVTLLFSVSQYLKAARAYLTGLENAWPRGSTSAPSPRCIVLRQPLDTSVDAELERTEQRPVGKGHRQCKKPIRTSRRSSPGRAGSILQEKEPMCRGCWGQPGTENPDTRTRVRGWPHRPAHREHHAPATLGGSLTRTVSPTMRRHRSCTNQIDSLNGSGTNLEAITTNSRKTG